VYLHFSFGSSTLVNHCFEHAAFRFEESLRAVKLCHSPIVQDQYAITVHDRIQSVSNREDCRVAKVFADHLEKMREEEDRKLGTWPKNEFSQ